MKKVALYSLLLIVGLALSQVLPGFLGEAWADLALPLRILTMTALAFVMIQVGYEFDLRRDRLRDYGWDYLVAMTAAAFPWIFVTGYFLLVLMPAGSATDFGALKEALLAGRFAAPTSAGVLFSMLAAAGLGATWLYRKARVLAIFDDLDTVLLMIPLKMLMVGLAWQLGVVVLVMFGMLWLAWRKLHAVDWPVTWRWLLAYAIGMVLVSEVIHAASLHLDDSVPIHVEILLPAFVLGAILRRRIDPATGHDLLESPAEKRVATVVSAAFMVLVGASMPALFATGATSTSASTVSATQEALSVTEIGLHVLAVSLLANLGKMFPLFCYRREAVWKERLALSIGMWPRGEVGAGVLVVSLGYGIGGPVLTVALLSLALNLVATGLFIVLVRRLLDAADRERRAAGIGPVVVAGSRGLD
ncbi:MAG: sodium:proton antiporter [Planctomycetes bacterium]|nr:sodium:proton antiporter [Planctomycetota bacterium]